MREQTDETRPENQPFHLNCLATLRSKELIFIRLRVHTPANAALGERGQNEFDCTVWPASTNNLLFTLSFQNFPNHAKVKWGVRYVGIR